eukprot:CAMPEP_0177741656 /NCGR_PEP_ID=MMETSP0484_2-20121128/28227_1 /TAXON_ID=354590 /ORGANISM="Rhodomonas lens, Strain RHODO" /LENGTH=134 /DNA_ID=CAMNT_0019255903 /DNA_START=155 /DNA_END=555 /DNA_ORIENTATION=+
MASSLENSAHNGAAEEVEEHGDEGGEGEEEGLTSDVANNSVEDELSGRDPGKGPHHHMPPPLPPLDMAGGARGVVNAQMIRYRRRGPKGGFLEAMEEMGNGSMDSLEFIITGKQAAHGAARLRTAAADDPKQSG